MFFFKKLSHFLDSMDYRTWDSGIIKESEMNIQHQNDWKKGSFYIDKDGKHVAVMTYM